MPNPDTYDYNVVGAGSAGCANAGTVYRPVGTLGMGVDASAPVSPTLQVRGVDAPWAADASIMPAVTSANTNAPSMKIGHRAASFIVA